MPRAVLATVFVCFVASVAEAQTCLGAPSFRDNPGQAGFGMGLAPGTQTLGAMIGGGGDTMFGRFTVGRTHHDDVDRFSTALIGTLGAEVGGAPTGRVAVCPQADLQVLLGPTVGELKVSGFGTSAGIALGIVAVNGAAVSVVPTIGVGVGYRRMTARWRELEETIGDKFGVGQVGVGLVFNRVFAIVPGVAVPFGLNHGERSLTLGLAFNFGG